MVSVAARLQLHESLGDNRFRRSVLFFSVIASLTFLSSHGRAEDSVAAAEAEICRIFSGVLDEGHVQELFAKCGEHALALGPVSDFKTVSNVDLGATLVDARHGGERRLLLLTIQEGGRPLVEDLSGQIALAAGRGPMSSIADVEIDLESFAQNGDMDVRQQAEKQSRKIGRIDLRQQVVRERDRRMAERRVEQ